MCSCNLQSPGALWHGSSVAWASSSARRARLWTGWGARYRGRRLTRSNVRGIGGHWMGLDFSDAFGRKGSTLTLMPPRATVRGRVVQDISPGAGLSLLRTPRTLMPPPAHSLNPSIRQCHAIARSWACLARRPSLPAAPSSRRPRRLSGMCRSGRRAPCGITACFEASPDFPSLGWLSSWREESKILRSGVSLCDQPLPVGSGRGWACPGGQLALGLGICLPALSAFRPGYRAAERTAPGFRCRVPGIVFPSGVPFAEPLPEGTGLMGCWRM